MTATLAQRVRDRWAVLLQDGDFAITEETDGVVLLTSVQVRIVVARSPRGEVSVEVHRHDQESWQGWSYTGLVGTASTQRLLELALAEMRADPAVLRGDQAMFGALQERAATEAKAWTAFYGREGPRPMRRRPFP